MRVLCLDDDQIYLTVAQGYLKVLGASDIQATSDYNEAALIVQEQSIDLILLDLNMPGQDGLAFLRTLSEIGYKGSIVIASGENASIVSSSGFIGRKLGLKINATLQKPLQIAELRDAFEGARQVALTATDQAGSKPAAQGKLMPILHYQPQYSVRSGALVGLEALVRGKDASGRIFGAASVLEKAANDERHFDFTANLFDIFCRDVSELRARGFTCNFSFNVDALCLEQNEFVPMLSKSIKRHDITAEGITIELIESQLPDDESWLLEVIARISIAGFEVSMDDFSTGAASFELLRAGAFREVKLDANMIRHSRQDEASAKFIGGVVDIAQAMNIRVVAEGVEGKDDKERLTNLGIDILQGYYFGKPADKNDLSNAPSDTMIALSAAS